MNVEDITLGEIQKRTEELAGAWNGSDEKFNFEGELRSSDDAEAAVQLLKEIEEVGITFASLNI